MNSILSWKNFVAARDDSELLTFSPRGAATFGNCLGDDFSWQEGLVLRMIRGSQPGQSARFSKIQIRAIRHDC
jgi:hypothetical protein